MRKKKGEIKFSLCHPDRNYFCKDMCKQCYARQNSKKWAKANADKRYTQDVRLQLNKKYGITFEQYEEMLVKQNGVCFLCEKTEDVRHGTKLKALCVDHDHKTGRIRSLLCTKYNLAIAQFEDRPNILNLLPQYLGLKI